MAILNYTTKIDYNKTVSEIQALIAKQGASKVMVDYSNGFPQALSFQVLHKGSALNFRLPANHKSVMKVLNNQKGVAASYRTEEHAKKVCWRIIKDWIEAQMAIIQAEQADIATIFLPYAITADNSTVAEKMLSDKGKGVLMIG